MKKYRWTFTGMILAVVLWAGISSQNIDAFEVVAEFLQRYESHELNEFFFPVAIIYVFAMADLVRRHHEQEVEIAKLRIYRHMLKATQHIMNNFLQKMMLFKLAADETEDFDPSMLSLYDQIIDEASDQIKGLSNIRNLDEQSIDEAIRFPAQEPAVRETPTAI